MLHVAKKFKAFDSPLGSRELYHRGGKVRIYVSGREALDKSNAEYVGYTKLEKTKAINVDRIEVGKGICYRVYLEPFNSQEISFAFCIDDIENKWVAVLQKESSNVKVATIQGALGAACVVLVAVLFSLITALMSNDSTTTTDTERLTEITTQITSGGYSETSAFGSSVIDENGVVQDGATAEDVLNARIEQSTDDAKKERESLHKGVTVAIEGSTGSAASEEGETSREKDEASKENDETPPVSTPSETVIIRDVTNDVADTDVLAEVKNPGIGDITVYAGKETVEFCNTYSSTLTVSFKCGNTEYSVNIPADGKTTVDLCNVTTETAKVDVKMTLDGDNAQDVLSTTITVYVL